MRAEFNSSFTCGHIIFRCSWLARGKASRQFRFRLVGMRFSPKQLSAARTVAILFSIFTVVSQTPHTIESACPLFSVMWFIFFFLLARLDVNASTIVANGGWNRLYTLAQLYHRGFQVPIVILMSLKSILPARSWNLIPLRRVQHPWRLQW